jgi:MOSC domain-containing protein YiiM
MADAERGPWGDETRHLPIAVLEPGVEALRPPRDVGELVSIVARGVEGRAVLQQVELTVESGVPGDAWARDQPEMSSEQISVMRADVARLFANGQEPSLLGDNLFVELDLSVDNLPTGSRLRIGSAVLEVTPEPHNGCRKFRQRVGGDALRLTADPRFREQRLRGLFLRVVEPGTVAVGGAIEVLTRGR